LQTMVASSFCNKKFWGPDASFPCKIFKKKWDPKVWKFGAYRSI
jgi:hypothetical protein